MPLTSVTPPSGSHAAPGMPVRPGAGAARRPARYSRRRWTLPTLVAAGAVFVAVAGVGRPELFLLPIAGTLCLLGLLAVMRWPEPALQLSPLLVLMASTKFRLRDPRSFQLGIADAQVVFELALYGVLMIVIVGVLAARRPRLFPPRWAGWLLGSYVLIVGMSTFWSSTPKLTGLRAAQLATLLAIALLSVRVLGGVRFLRSMAGSLLAYLVIFVPLGFIVGSQFMNRQRFTWYAVHPIEAGLFLGLATVLAVGYSAIARSHIRWRQVLLWIGALVSFALLTQTGSRGPLLACVAGVTAFAVIRYVRGWAAPALAAGLLVLAVLYLNIGRTFDEIVADAAGRQIPGMEVVLRGQRAEQVLGFSGREQLWEGVGTLIARRPVLGHGYQGARGEMTQLVRWRPQGAHNAWLQSAIDVGIAGTLPLALAVVGALSLCLRPRLRRGRLPGHPPALVGSVLVFLMVAAVASEVFAGSPDFTAFLLFGCIFFCEDLYPGETSRALEAPQVRATASLKEYGDSEPATRADGTVPVPTGVGTSSRA